MPRRLLRLFILALLLVTLPTWYFYQKSRPSYALYRALSELEVAQSRQFIQGNNATSRFVLFKQLQGAGFNNQAQEILLLHHLALETSRTYVYQPLIWRPRGSHSQVALSAFLLGPTRGSISSAIFDEACPTAQHVKLRVENAALWANAKAVLSGAERCIVVDDWILNWNFLASTALHPTWPLFQSYLAKHFEWSTAIQSVATRAHSTLNLRSKPFNTDGEPYMALHIRRGDFEEHCHILSHDHIGFTTWATLPELQRSVLPPGLDPTNETSAMEHCYPSLFRILSAVDKHARERPHLRTLHILHDGAWDHPTVYIQVYKLEAALTDAARALKLGWPGGPLKRVTHSSMLPIHRGEADYAVTVDVELGRNAEVFIGNGFSSLSTQVVALRLGADGGRIQDITLI